VQMNINIATARAWPAVDESQGSKKCETNHQTLLRDVSQRPFRIFLSRVLGVNKRQEGDSRPRNMVCDIQGGLFETRGWILSWTWRVSARWRLGRCTEDFPALLARDESTLPSSFPSPILPRACLRLRSARASDKETWKTAPQDQPLELRRPVAARRRIAIGCSQGMQMELETCVSAGAGEPQGSQGSQGSLRGAIAAILGPAVRVWQMTLRLGGAAARLGSAFPSHFTACNNKHYRSPG